MISLDTCRKLFVSIEPQPKVPGDTYVDFRATIDYEFRNTGFLSLLAYQDDLFWNRFEPMRRVPTLKRNYVGTISMFLMYEALIEAHPELANMKIRRGINCKGITHERVLQLSACGIKLTNQYTLRQERDLIHAFLKSRGLDDESQRYLRSKTQYERHR